MVIVEGRRAGWRDRLVFFPSRDELAELIAARSPFSSIRVKQTAAEFPVSGAVLASDRFETSVLDLTRTEEELWLGLHPKSCRYKIRRAERLEGDLALHWNDRRAADDFFVLYNDFVSQKRHTRPLTRRRLREYLQVSDVNVCYLGSEPIAGHVNVRDNRIGRARLVMSASARFDVDRHAREAGFCNRYLHWQEILHYKQRGMKVYDFGGVGAVADSVAEFKRSFGGEQLVEHDYLIGSSATRVAMRLASVVRSGR